MLSAVETTWGAVLANPLMIGGDIESEEYGVVYRGPLAKVYDDAQLVYFTSPWIARFDSKTGTWEKHDTTLSYVTKEVVPRDIGDGKIFFAMPGLGNCTIFPRTHTSKLDPQKVRGLAKASERLLALYPDLPFNLAVAEQVIREKSSRKVAARLPQLPQNVTMSDLLALFKYDSGAEEFLWNYIETVTGEKDLHHKVY